MRTFKTPNGGIAGATAGGGDAARAAGATAGAASAAADVRRRPTSEAEFAERKASEVSDYERRLAAEIVAMLPEDREEAAMGLGYVEAILSLELPPPASTRAPHASC